ncbi:unnamed protein product [Choristocarpus tenellus]
MTQGAFMRAKFLLRFLGELVTCGLVQAQEYGDMLATLCSGYVNCNDGTVKQPCKDMLVHMLLSCILCTGSTLVKGWTGGFSDLLDGIRSFMGQRPASFNCSGMRAIFHSPDEDSLEDDDKASVDAGHAGSGRGEQEIEPVVDSLSLLWDVVSSLHDSNWPDEELPKAVPKLCKKDLIHQKLINIESISLPEEVVTPETIPEEVRGMGPFEMANCTHLGDQNLIVSSPALRVDWNYCLSIMGEWTLYDTEGGKGPASCCPDLLPKKEMVVLREFCKDTIVFFQPTCQQDGTKVGKWALLVEQLMGIGDLAPEGCQVAYLVMETLFVVLLQVSTPRHLRMVCQRAILELCRAVPKEAPAALSYCTGQLFQDLERMDTVVASRFGQWFADHLKNTEYKWPFWKHWLNVVELGSDHPQRSFVSNVLAAIVKLSYMDR